jgi:hypothetical protein
MRMVSGILCERRCPGATQVRRHPERGRARYAAAGDRVECPNVAAPRPLYHDPEGARRRARGGRTAPSSIGENNAPHGKLDAIRISLSIR